MAHRTDRRPDKAAQAAREDQNETSDLWFDFGHGDEEAGTAAGARCEDDRAAQRGDWMQGAGAGGTRGSGAWHAGVGHAGWAGVVTDGSDMRELGGEPGGHSSAHVGCQRPARPEMVSRWGEGDSTMCIYYTYM